MDDNKQFCLFSYTACTSIGSYVQTMGHHRALFDRWRSCSVGYQRSCWQLDIDVHGAYCL